MVMPFQMVHGNVSSVQLFLHMYFVCRYVSSTYYVFLYSSLGSNAEGSTLNITRINREHMGTYICEANNGIGEVARQNFKVQVHCKSLSVRICQQKGGA